MNICIKAIAVSLSLSLSALAHDPSWVCGEVAVNPEYGLLKSQVPIELPRFNTRESCESANHYVLPFREVGTSSFYVGQDAGRPLYWRPNRGCTVDIDIHVKFPRTLTPSWINFNKGIIWKEAGQNGWQRVDSLDIEAYISIPSNPHCQPLPHVDQ